MLPTALLLHIHGDQGQLVAAKSRTSVHGDDEVEGGHIRQTLAGLQRIVQCDVGLCICGVNPAPQSDVPC